MADRQGVWVLISQNGLLIKHVSTRMKGQYSRHLSYETADLFDYVRLLKQGGRRNKTLEC
jgi:hypothetical protein